MSEGQAPANGAEPLLCVEHLTKLYQTTLAVEDVGFSVGAGEIVGLLGPNGAGKTTILRCIAGIVQPTHGRIVIAGADLARDELRAKSALGFVPEVPNPYELLTVWEHLAFIARVFGRLAGFPERAEALLHRLSLAEKRDELVLTLSKGMKQKLTIACALIHEPPVILLDEPIIGVDPRGQREVTALLQEAQAAGRAVLISTHILSTAQELCDDILILHRGRILAGGTLSELRARANAADDRSLEDLFLDLTSEEPGHGAAAAT